MIESNQSVAGQIGSAKVVLYNAQNHEEIKSNMAEMGYGDDEIQQGETLLKNAIDQAEKSQIDKHEKSEANDVLKDAVVKVIKVYRIMRKKAKVIFRKDHMVLSQLGLLDEIPNDYIGILTVVRTFTNGLLNKDEWLTRVEKLKLGRQDIEKLNEQVDQVEVLRANYLKEKGESENTTQVRDKALAELGEWVRDYKAVSRIAMEDQPQLLEALGILVK